MSLREELKKRKAFDSVEQEAALAIMRTSDLVENRLARFLREFGLSLTQYNVLRILRGEGKPLPCLEVANRMVQVAPAITRVVDQLLKLGLITKTQSGTDRRVYELALTARGVQFLKNIDTPLLDLHASLLAKMNRADQKTLIRLLEEARAGMAD